MTIFHLPDLGEGLPDAEIHEWHVNVGDEVKADQPIVSMETAKAVVEVPSPQTGVIAKLHGDVGDIIKTGSALVEFVASESSSPTEDKGTVVGNIDAHGETLEETGKIAEQKATTRIMATPAVRQLARQLQIDLSQVQGSGPRGQITQADVERASGTEYAESLHGARRAMAMTMAASHAQVAPVTLMDDADIDHWSSDEDITVRLVQAMVAASKAVPQLNTWYDARTQTRTEHDSVNLGLAVDTGEQLVVPVINAAETLDAGAIRSQVNDFKQRVADHTIKPEDLQNATITLSNFGKFSGRYASPIIVPPMVAILAVGQKRVAPVAVADALLAHKILPLSLTIDHRVVTGAEASQFLAAVIADLQR